MKQVTTNHLESFAREGLRTLCCAVAEIPHDIYEEWKHTYHRASTSMQNREEKLSDAANLIENNLVLLGATAIEDKLQDQVSRAKRRWNCPLKWLSTNALLLFAGPGNDRSAT